MGEVGGLACLRLQLQAQAFPQCSSANAGRVEALQQAKGHGKLMRNLLQRLGLVAAQRCGQRFKGIFQQAIIAQRADQEIQRGALGLGQAQGRRLTAQMFLQRDLRAAPFSRVLAAATGRVAGAGACIDAPFRVVGGHVDGAVAVPV